MENINSLLAISPIDGRYRNITQNISEYFSEYAFIKYRVFVELDWLNYLLHMEEVYAEAKDYTPIFEEIKTKFNIKEAERVKEIESKTNHDVKAIEYYVREKLEEYSLGKFCHLVHFACTSEDINNTAYGKMITDFINNILLKNIDEMINIVKEESLKLSNVPMLGHTHGQNATPTTVGKELAVFVYRWNSIYEYIKNIKLKAKFSGAVGNFNGHLISYPEIDWITVCKKFINEEGLEFNPLTTQIESHDMICMLFNFMKLFNNVTMDFNSDMWLYISRGDFKQKTISGEVGSSIMPHKVNPINHENSMANIRIANSIFDSLTTNLQISRMQRDLSDSSMLRNIGVVFAHTIVSINQTIKGFSKMEVNKSKLEKELEEAPEVLAEAIQTILRKNKYNNAYEMLKELTRGKEISLEEIRKFVNNLDINESDKQVLMSLTPAKYIGLAEKLTNINTL